MPEPVPYQIKEIQSGTGLLRHRTEMMSTDMPMPAASASVPIAQLQYAKRQPVKATGGIQLSSDPQNFEEVNTLSVENEDIHSMYEQFVQSHWSRK